jgi:hypothetical protein
MKKKKKKKKNKKKKKEKKKEKTGLGRHEKDWRWYQNICNKWRSACEFSGPTIL